MSLKLLTMSKALKKLIAIHDQYALRGKGLVEIPGLYHVRKAGEHKGWSVWVTTHVGQRLEGIHFVLDAEDVQ